MKAFIALVTASTWLALAGTAVTVAPAHAADRVVERGIVQSVAPTVVVLRALDGTEVTVELGPATRYRLNGRSAPVSAIRPGFVAEVVHDGPGPALALRAFGGGTLLESGVLERQRLGVLVVRRTTGGIVQIAVTARTGIWVNGRRVARRALRRGMVVEIVLARDGTARVVLARTAA